MRLPPDLVPATMISRPNRFALWVELEGQVVYAHLPSSGRMGELLLPGARLLLRPTPGEGRRTTHRAVLVRHGRGWVSIDSHVAPALLTEFLFGGAAPLGVVQEVKYEVQCGPCRLDLLATTSLGEWLIETKSVTLARGGLGLFPDAPTLRGTRHLRELTRVAKEGQRAAAAFVAQRADITAIMANGATDPAFEQALREAAEAGVVLLGVRCRVTRQRITPCELVPVLT